MISFVVCSVARRRVCPPNTATIYRVQNLPEPSHLLPGTKSEPIEDADGPSGGMCHLPARGLTNQDKLISNPPNNGSIHNARHFYVPSPLPSRDSGALFTTSIVDLFLSLGTFSALGWVNLSRCAMSEEFARGFALIALLDEGWS
jgi:hypothetical protein